MASERIHLEIAAARELAERALSAIGFAADEAAIVADHLIDAALCGYEYSGLPKLLNIAEAPRFKAPRRPIAALRETEVSLMLDGGNAVGMLALARAADAAIAKAARHGVALVGVADSWMSGRSAYYVERIARAGLVAIHTASSSRMVAPFGGIAAALGTNPIALAVPTAGDPLVFDMGTSAFMMTELLLRERLGQSLPEDVAIDAAGEPTRDPTDARRGALLPFGGASGGYKGFGLALMVQALGILGGSALDREGDSGYLFIAFKPDLLMPPNEFRTAVTALVERVKATPRRPGVAEIRIPSERAFAARRRALVDGIDIDRAVHEALLRLASRNG